jgi:ferrochelatase
VCSYLREFLSDPKVIDLPTWFRFLLVHGIIAPIRSFRSARLYDKLATDRGFPLIFHSKDLEAKVGAHLPGDVDLYLAMRYGEPSLKKLLQQIRNNTYDELRVFPLYPQYASSTTGSIVSLSQDVLKGSQLYGNTRVIPQFHREDGFIKLWQKKLSDYKPSDYDAILFSYHGIPVRQTQSAHPEQTCDNLNCTKSYYELNDYCYHAACYQTTRSIAGGLNIETEKVYTAFQSRFGRNWLAPYTDQTLLQLVKEEKKNVLVVSPSFVADCLETTIEIGHEYTTLFKEAGGESLTLVPSLNSDADWGSFIATFATGSYDASISLANWTLQTRSS